jgi:hypothetical protein
MKKNRFFDGKTRAQAMVEFAIALPILLLMLYGIIEAGRLLFMYSTVVTASRQAVRYGSATGEGLGGYPRYQDCEGIREAARKVAFLGAFDEIKLQYDTGPGTQTKGYCESLPGDPSLNDFILRGNRTRLIVTVRKEFSPLVRLVPFFERPIVATSARTILYSVPIVVEQEQQEWYKVPTEIIITSDNPDPSQIEEWVTVTFQVNNLGGSAGPPTGPVHIIGANINCDVNLTAGDNGSGNCKVRFDSAGDMNLQAVYEGDSDHLASTDQTEPHKVEIWTTTTEITLDEPDFSEVDEVFTVAVRVKGGSITPTGTVDIDGGQGVRCTIPLSDDGVGNAVGSCQLSYNNQGSKLLTASYNGDSLHKPSSDTEPHTVYEATPTPTLVPTATKVPTSTPIPATPTITPTPTLIPTAVGSCSDVTHAPISLAGGVMSMTISNPYPFPIVMKDITVTWNDDKGHNDGNKQLFLTKVLVGSTAIWTGEIDRASTYTIATPALLPASTSTTITFVFHQTYDNLDGTEQIYINLATPGCENNPINSNQP